MPVNVENDAVQISVTIQSGLHGHPSLVVQRNANKNRVPLPVLAGTAFSIVALLFSGLDVFGSWLPETLFKSWPVQLTLEVWVVLLPAFLVLILAKYNLKEVLRLNKPKVSEVIISAALPVFLVPATIFLAAIVMLLVEMVFGSTADFTGFTTLMSETNIFFMILSVAVMPAVCEEVLFRGVVLKGLQKNGIVFGIILTSILFGLFHMDFQRFIAQALMGAVAGIVVYRTNSLFCGMIVHFMNNLIAILLSFTLQPQEVIDGSNSALEGLRASAESLSLDVSTVVITTIVMYLVAAVVFLALPLPLFFALFRVTKGKVQVLRAETQLYTEKQLHAEERLQTEGHLHTEEHLYAGKKMINPVHYLAFVPGLLIIGVYYGLTALYLSGLAQ